MKFAKEHQSVHQQFGSKNTPITEQAICYALEDKGLRYDEHFTLYKTIDNIAFNKTKKHVVDLVLTSCNGDKLYVEVKGQMTYLEVNKLRYLLGLGRHFYIMQLTEIDWIEPYDKNQYEREFQKSKHDFDSQIQELVDFVNGKVSGKELSIRSLQRLNDFVKYREGDIDRWKNK